MTERLDPPDDSRVASTPVRRQDLLVLRAGTLVVRLHPLGGSHPCDWNEMRHWGPTTSRFDHHPPPIGNHPDHGIAYLAHGRAALATVIAEVFQSAGSVVDIDTADTRNWHLTAFSLAADLSLLDTSRGWVTRAGGNQAINSGPRDVSRQWARAIDAHTAVDGIGYPSSVFGPGRCVAVWERATVFPARPTVTRRLVDLGPALDNAAQLLGVRVI